MMMRRFVFCLALPEEAETRNAFSSLEEKTNKKNKKNVSDVLGKGENENRTMLFIPPELLPIVARHLNAVRSARLTCKAMRDAVDSTVRICRIRRGLLSTLSPRSTSLLKRLTSLQRVDVLAASDVSRVTYALRTIQKTTSGGLVDLRFVDCDFTDIDYDPLSKLLATLDKLEVVRFVRLPDIVSWHFCQVLTTPVVDRLASLRWLEISAGRGTLRAGFLAVAFARLERLTLYTNNLVEGWSTFGASIDASEFAAAVAVPRARLSRLELDRVRITGIDADGRAFAAVKTALRANASLKDVSVTWGGMKQIGNLLFSAFAFRPIPAVKQTLRFAFNTTLHLHGLWLKRMHKVVIRQCRLSRETVHVVAAAIADKDSLLQHVELGGVSADEDFVGHDEHVALSDAVRRATTSRPLFRQATWFYDGRVRGTMRDGGDPVDEDE